MGQPFTMGYNAMTDKYVDMLEAGVIDPAKVTKNGLINSCSIAGIMLTTQAAMVERKAGSPNYAATVPSMPPGMAF